MDRLFFNRPLRHVLGAFLLLGLALGGAGCSKPAQSSTSEDLSQRPIRVVATTSIIADLVAAIGADRVAVTGLMGAGVDPHLYKAKASDVARMSEADVVFYNGLHLEGKMAEVFERMGDLGIQTVAVAEVVEPDLLLQPEVYAGNYDPHIWFDVNLWMKAAQAVGEALARMDPAHAATYQAQTDAYLLEMQDLQAYVETEVARVESAQRVLITAHDAFNYFGVAYGFEVRGLQGLSTATEAGTADVQALSDFIVERQIPAIFVESSVPPRNIEAVQAACRAKGFDVAIGGYLYSDALGSPDTPEGTYLGTVRWNVRTIVGALLGEITGATE